MPSPSHVPQSGGGYVDVTFRPIMCISVTGLYNLICILVLCVNCHLDGFDAIIALDAFLCVLVTCLYN